MTVVANWLAMSSVIGGDAAGIHAHPPQWLLRQLTEVLSADGVNRLVEAHRLREYGRPAALRGTSCQWDLERMLKAAWRVIPGGCVMDRWKKVLEAAPLGYVRKLLTQGEGVEERSGVGRGGPCLDR